MQEVIQQTTESRLWIVVPLSSMQALPVCWPLAVSYTHLDVYKRQPLLGFVLIGCYVMDRRTWPAAGLAPWLPMRLQLTIVASLSCFLAAGAT